MASCKQLNNNLDRVYSNLKVDLLEKFDDHVDDILTKYSDHKRLLISLFCLICKIDNETQLCNRSFLTGKQYFKTYELNLNEEVKGKPFLYRILNSAMQH